MIILPLSFDPFHRLPLLSRTYCDPTFRTSRANDTVSEISVISGQAAVSEISVQNPVENLLFPGQPWQADAISNACEPPSGTGTNTSIRSRLFRRLFCRRPLSQESAGSHARKWPACSGSRDGRST